MKEGYLKGKGAQVNPSNQFLKHQIVRTHPEGLDEPSLEGRPLTQVFEDTPRQIISKNNSPDLRLTHSINAYQGCEHGCVYCYARNAHEYWGFSAGLDFETKIIVKRNAAQLLEKQFLSKSWKATPIMLSGNTDCYQPLERKYQLTRALLEVFLRYRNPVSIITKNALILRDLDLLKALAHLGLVHVFFSINTLDESLRRVLEPRTASASKKLHAMRQLSSHGVPVGVMNAPLIPGLNHHETAEVLKQSARAGALAAGYTVVRLNGQLEGIFKDWLRKNFPDRMTKIWNQVKSMHGGQMNDTQWGRRISGEGPYAKSIAQLFEKSRARYFEGRSLPSYNLTLFRHGGTMTLF